MLLIITTILITLLRLFNGVNFVIKILESSSVSGVGGNRTLVQTSEETAFYKFSFQLIFDNTLAENNRSVT